MLRRLVASTGLRRGRTKVGRPRSGHHRVQKGARRLRNADRAMLITSSAFTPAAIQTAAELNIELIDGDQLGGQDAGRGG
ncbi:MAG: hypothetical protein B7Y99_01050 [Caulobacterales bacterium 32-69-10]|nr:MAG: hypothetical protein B7Y99_01050 [Caulobacterales bacterium 32-69-10]